MFTLIGVSATGNGFDGPSILQAISTWVALLMLTFWVGGVLWETWVLPYSPSSDPDLRAAVNAIHSRFRRLAPSALLLLLLANVGLVVATDWSGGFSPSQLGAILFGNYIDVLWWLRQIIIVSALLLALLTSNQDRDRQILTTFMQTGVSPATTAAEDLTTVWPILDWQRELLGVLRAVPELPKQFATGFEQQRWPARIQCLLGIGLVIVFAFSGTSAVVFAPESGYTSAIEVLHLFCEVVWLGGLFYIGLVLLPASSAFSARQRIQALAFSLPRFSALAFVCILLLATTGLLDALLHLTSWTQLVTTTYGRTLTVKIELLVALVAVSVYHAFFLYPRLVQAYTVQDNEPVQTNHVLKDDKLVSLVGVSESGMTREREAQNVEQEQVGSDTSTSTITDSAPDTAPHHASGMSSHPRVLEERLRGWLRREALLGGAVLLCVALLGIFAGSLAPNLIAISSKGNHSAGPYVASQAISTYTVTMNVTPDTFGTNTFTVTIKNAAGRPVTGAQVTVATSSLDMDMGIQSVQLKAIGNSAPGSYRGQSELTMTGHWQATVQIVLPATSHSLTTNFQFQVTY